MTTCQRFKVFVKLAPTKEHMVTTNAVCSVEENPCSPPFSFFSPIHCFMPNVFHLKIMPFPPTTLRMWQFSRGQKIPCLLWSLKVHYHIHNRLPLDTILSHNPDTLFLLRSMLTITSLLHLNLQAVSSLKVSN